MLHSGIIVGEVDILQVALNLRDPCVIVYMSIPNYVRGLGGFRPSLSAGEAVDCNDARGTSAHTLAKPSSLN